MVDVYYGFTPDLARDYLALHTEADDSTYICASLDDIAFELSRSFGSAVLIVAYCGGEPAGCGFIEFADEGASDFVAHARHGYVLPKYRMDGVGHEITMRGIEIATALGCNRIYGTVAEDGPADYYTRLGFRTLCTQIAMEL